MEQRRSLRFASLLDEILSDGDLDELRETIAVCSRGCVQGSCQLGQREAENRQAAKEQAWEDEKWLTPAELSARFGCSVHSVKKAMREGRLTPRYPEPGAKRNGKVQVGEYRRMVG